MNRFAASGYLSPKRRGYTLVEILVATTLSLIILGAVVHLFGTVGTTITQSRSIMESADRLRAVQNRLQSDLEGVTVTPIPPRRPESNEGYLEIIKGRMLQSITRTYSAMNGANQILPIPLPVDTDKSNAPDTSVGSLANILMFTTRSTGKPFTGKFMNNTVESSVAEVAYFVRGNTLYRRQLLVAPQLLTGLTPSAVGFYANNDISVRWGTGNIAVPNTLSDLTRRECRFAHPLSSTTYDARFWSYLGLPTSKETSDLDFVAGVWDVSRIDYGATKPNVMDEFYKRRSDLKKTDGNPNPYPMFDYWTTNPTARLSDSEIIKNTTTPPVTYQGAALADDVVLTNVIGFDIRVWDAGYPILQDNNTGNVLKPGDSKYILPGDPRYNANLPYTVLGFGGYVDLGYYPLYNYGGWSHTLPCPAPPANFYHYGYPGPNSTPSASNLCGSDTVPCVYDTWSNTYDGTQASDGFDNVGMGIVDNNGERTYATPYPAPLRGIQVIIRIFEPDSRQIREVTIEQDFLPK